MHCVKELKCTKEYFMSTFLTFQVGGEEDVGEIEMLHFHVATSIKKKKKMLFPLTKLIRFHNLKSCFVYIIKLAFILSRG